MLILAQIPSFHSLRHINLISLTLSLGYSALATAASLILGRVKGTRLYMYTFTLISFLLYLWYITYKHFRNGQVIPNMHLQETTLFKDHQSVSYLMLSMVFR